MAMALILAVSRRVVEGAKALKAGKFEGWTPTWMMGRRIRGKSLGIIGMGRSARRSPGGPRPSGLSIHYHNRRPIPGHIAEALEATHWESLDQMLARMDVVSLNCPHTPGTYHLLSARRLKLMPPHAILINTARGGVVDEAALAARLAEGCLAGAGLDVYENEPRVDPRLLKMPNVVLLPHLGSATIEGRAEMGDKVLINMKAFQDGHRHAGQGAALDVVGR